MSLEIPLNPFTLLRNASNILFHTLLNIKQNSLVNHFSCIYNSCDGTDTPKIFACCSLLIPDQVNFGFCLDLQCKNLLGIMSLLG